MGAGLQVGMDLRVEAGLQVATGLRDDSRSGPVSGGEAVARRKGVPGRSGAVLRQGRRQAQRVG